MNSSKLKAKFPPPSDLSFFVEKIQSNNLFHKMDETENKTTNDFFPEQIHVFMKEDFQ